MANAIAALITLAAVVVVYWSPVPTIKTKSSSALANQPTTESACPALPRGCALTVRYSSQ